MSGVANSEKPSPTIVSLSRDEMLKKASAWMKENYSICKEANPDKYYERLGFMVDFITDVFPE